MKKLLIYLGLADEPVPKQAITRTRTVQIERNLSYNQWMIYICEQLGYPKDVIESYKQRI